MPWDLEGMAAAAVLLFKVGHREASLTMVALALGDGAGSLKSRSVLGPFFHFSWGCWFFSAVD